VGDTADRLWQVVEPYVAAEGIELDDIELTGNGTSGKVRITVDSKEPVDVGRIADLSRGISRLLDEHEPYEGSYTMEVSTPGLERKLRRPRHYEKSVGARIKVKTRPEIDGERVHTGTLVETDQEGFVMNVDGSERHIEYGDVTSAQTVFVWGKQPKPGKR
jgi:ribosome maturation factor RimP